MVTKQQFKNLFKEPLDLDVNEKWLTIGFFTGVAVLFTIIMPLAFYNSILTDLGIIPIRDVVSYLILLKGLIVILPMLGYLLCWWIFKNQIVCFCVNIAILMYRDYEISKAKKNGMEKLSNVE